MGQSERRCYNSKCSWVESGRNPNWECEIAHPPMIFGKGKILAIRTSKNTWRMKAFTVYLYSIYTVYSVLMYLRRRDLNEKNAFVSPTSFFFNFENNHRLMSKEGMIFSNWIKKWNSDTYNTNYTQWLDDEAYPAFSICHVVIFDWFSWHTRRPPFAAPLLWYCSSRTTPRGWECTQSQSPALDATETQNHHNPSIRSIHPSGRAFLWMNQGSQLLVEHWKANIRFETNLISVSPSDCN